MKRIRLAATILAMMTVLIDGLLAINPATPGLVVLSAALAAACLAVVTPFDAMGPPERRRVVAACAVFVLGTSVSLGMEMRSASVSAAVGAFACLTCGGLLLLIWSFATRNRRRRPGWSNYYDL